MDQVFIAIFTAISDYVQSRPLLSLLMLVAIGVGLVGIWLFIRNIFKKHRRSWLIILGQTVPLTMAIFLFHLVVSTGKFPIPTIYYFIVVILAFLFIAIRLKTAPDSVIGCMGIFGIALWIVVFYLFFRVVSIEPIPPVIQQPSPSVPSAPAGRP